MEVRAIKTRVMQPPKDDLHEVIVESVEKIPEESILVVTSKVVAIDEGRCIKRKKGDLKKDEIIISESEKYLPRESNPYSGTMLCLANNLVAPAAGVDVSNGNGYYILWPKNPMDSVKKIYDFVKEKFGVRKFGVMIIDSHTIPLRWGVVGISLAHWGFCPLIDYRKKRDIFGRKSLRIVLANVVDSIAAAADLVMGQGGEQTPLALVSDIPFVKFGNCPEGTPGLEVDPDVDIYAPFLKAIEWKMGGKGRKKE